MKSNNKIIRESFLDRCQLNEKAIYVFGSVDIFPMAMYNKPKRRKKKRLEEYKSHGKIYTLEIPGRIKLDFEVSIRFHLLRIPPASLTFAIYMSLSQLENVKLI